MPSAFVHVIYTIYGLAFLYLGASLWSRTTQLREHDLAKAFRWLAGFGFLHGSTEILEMFLQVDRMMTGGEESVSVKILALSITTASYAVLMRFGIEMVFLGQGKKPNTFLQTLPFLFLIIWLAPLNQAAMGALPWANAAFISRYTLGAFGILITAYALLHYHEAITPKGFSSRDLRLAGWGFFFYFLLALVGSPDSGFFPESVLNTETFYQGTGFPVEVFRTIVAIIITVYVGQSLDIFNNLEKQRLADLVDSLQESERKIRRSSQSQQALSEVINESLKNRPLRELFDFTLQRIFSVPWLSLLPSGSIFLLDKKSGELTMAAQCGMNPETAKLCQRIEPGQCLCGKAFERKETVFHSEITPEHSVQHDGMEPHGHYCIPMLSQGKSLGVLNLYVKPNQTRNDDEEKFLKAVADSLVGILIRREAEESLAYQALHDPTTDLPNRLLLEQSLEYDLSRAIRDKSEMAVMVFNLDGLGKVNLEEGYETGDGLLREVAQRTDHCIRKSDMLARLAGDSFTVVLRTIASHEDIGLVADKILESLKKPFVIRGRTCHTGASIGVSHFPAHGERGETLLRHAEKAVIAAKEAGGNCWKSYQKEIG